MSADHRRFDIRTLERNFEKGLITREEYQKYLEELGDASENAETIESEFEEGVLESDEEDAQDESEADTD